MEKVVAYINEKHEGDADELKKAYQQLHRGLEQCVDSLKADGKRALENNEYDRVHEITGYLKILESIQAGYEHIEILLKSKAAEENDIVREPVHEIISLDGMEPHILTESFTNKKPGAFSICGRNYKCEDWKDVFESACNYLYLENPDLFKSFLSDEEMQGKKIKHFGTESDNLRSARKVKGTDLYIMTNMSANAICQEIIKMLGKYGIPLENVKVYLRLENVDKK